mmetsp:Transcript_25260/g.45441  ORF Transcript_25260/g.45441 Transcript_25260/m.45441 type:complete len:894 (-) Transcript_25260:174-2855(-)|eukprot:CAMPEP_0201881198 /NCGR_PEP_ID=MMETSP0902-20130614/11570_1 /ASSEMBLY_ACC=CAM_ASM_000551 /TAXON_ID=420261 /ORGANISM="Thalassiosira antarctica, Strain CCMP982" /LENGTH=893 /DNA_ID=CAMNT_0048409345 /DNA_START=38 /DNA_END=2719 /DNA_ORIENTATION=+
MILEREQWHLGYASLLRDCRGTGDAPAHDIVDIPSVGRALLLVHPDTDAMATARILSYMLRADGVPYQMRPCLGWERLKRILGRVGVIAPEDGNEDGNNNEEEGEDKNWVENETDIRAVVLMNMGANRNIAKLFRNSAAPVDLSQGSFPPAVSRSSQNNGKTTVRCYVFDCHRPYHLSNIHAGKNVVLFNDRPFEEEEIPSDGDNLSGDESSSSDESSDDDDSDDEQEFEGGKNESESEGEQEFELGDNEKDEKDGSDDSDNESERRTKRQKTHDVDPADDPAQDDPVQRDAGARRDDDLHDSDDDEGDGLKKQGANNAVNPLDTTAITADLTMNLDDTFDAASQTQTQEQTQSSNPITLMEQTQQSSSSTPITSFRELHRHRRNRIRLHYSSGSYHASPSAWTAYTLCRQLRFGDTPDLLWLACVGVTDAYLHGRLDVAGYGAMTVDLKRHVGRLFPNELVDRVGRAVYAEELELPAEGGSSSNNILTQIGLSENGRILSQSEYKFMLLRHTSLWDSLLHSNFVASKLQVWKSTGRQRLMELLARMGFPLDQCRQPWAFVGPGMRRRLRDRMEDCTEEYGLGNVSYTGFVRVTGYKSLLSASDMSYAVTALLECSAAAMDSGSSKENTTNDDDMLSEEDREDREMVEAFNVAFDALNSNGGSTSSANGGALTTMEGGVEGGDLSNLVNGGNMTGTTGLGAGIRLAMTLQRNIMATARNLVDRNAITRLSHFRYAYLHSSSSRGGGGGGGSSSSRKVVTPDNNNTSNNTKKDGSSSSSSTDYHVFAKPLVLTKLAHFLMDMHRENGKWTGTKSRPLVLLAEKPRSNTYMVVGYEYPEEAGNVVKNKFGQNFELAAKSMKGMFWFDSFDSNVVEVAGRDVQKFLEQLHYMMEQV